MIFQQSSAWIRTYDWCGYFLDVVGRPFDIRTHDRGPEGINLCLLVRRYVFAVLAAATIIGICFALYMLVTGLTGRSIQEYQHNREIQGMSVLHSALEVPLSRILIWTLGFVAIVASICCLFYVGAEWPERKNAFQRCVGYGVRWVGIAMGYAIFGIFCCVFYGLLWPFIKLWQMRPWKKTSAKKPVSPSLFKVVGQWIYGQMHGICFKIDVVEG